MAEKRFCESAPYVRSDHYILQCVKFSEASVFGLIYCVVAYKGVLTLYLNTVWFETTVMYYLSVKVDLRVLTV